MDTEREGEAMSEPVTTRGRAAREAARQVTRTNARWLALLVSKSHDPEAQAEAQQWADDWFDHLPGEPRVSTMDDTTYVSVPEFELWPTDPDWQPHDARIVYITRRSFTLNAPGHMTYHRPSRHTRHSDRTGCGIDIWSSGWEPGEQSSLIAIRRDVASRIARPCRVCGAD